jgi:hypothetical protein
MSLAQRILDVGRRNQDLQPVANPNPPITPSPIGVTKRVTFNEEEPFDFAHRQLSDVVIGEDFMATNEPTRHNEHFIHVSDLRELCPRAYVLAVRHNAKVFKSDYLKRAHSSSMKIVWVQGRASETHIRDSFIRRYANQVYGTWECVCGNSKYIGFNDRAILCNRCQVAHQFNETPIFDIQRKIVGTADMPVLDKSGLVFVELKTMKKDDFENLTAPSPEHVVQVMTYRDMAIRNKFGGHPISKKAVVMYAAKEFSVKGAYKEFVLDTEDSAYDFARATIQLLYRKAEIIRDALTNGTLPPLINKCVGEGVSTHAKGCPMFVNCMALK